MTKKEFEKRLEILEGIGDKLVSVIEDLHEVILDLYEESLFDSNIINGIRKDFDNESRNR